jgi:uncharacterized membrane protein
MTAWTSKEWGAVIGVLLVVLTAWLGLGVAALAVVFGAVGFFVGKFLDGELDVEELRARAQGRSREM